MSKRGFLEREIIRGTRRIPRDCFILRIPKTIQNRLAISMPRNDSARSEIVVHINSIVELLEERIAINNQVA